ncbi:hypothetical protein SASPL_114191 [Salvia splendens]|uniref:Uncharacterized protein n=1 Tax=Salvia splendens TaxID=180675 RepID=A0A8X8Y0V4_SALSN|nr:hypothetical protein SASPL_114191 [Salvia splendens]
MEAEYHNLKTFPSFRYKIDTGAISRQGSEGDGEIPRATPSFMHAEGSEAESDIPRLPAVSSFKQVMEAAAEWSGSEGELPRYTSLKDVMSNLSPRGGGADIPNIRNELVKHAASAYVLSATVINPAQRDQDSRIYDRIKSWCLTCHVGLPLCWPLVDFVCQIVRRIRNGLRGVVEVT